MKILIITATEARGFSLADHLSMHHDIHVLHTDDVAFECSFSESTINEATFQTYPFGDYQQIIYLTSPNLSYDYLTTTLERLKELPNTNITCISERSINLSIEPEHDTELYICEGFRSLLGDRLSLWYTVPIYGEDFLPDAMIKILDQREKQNQIILPGEKTDAFEAIHISDLITALETHFDNFSSSWPVLLSVHQSTTLEDLGSALHNLLPQAEIVYSPNDQIRLSQNQIGSTINGDTVFVNENWMPKHRFFQDLPSVMKLVEQGKARTDYSERPTKTNTVLRIALFLGLFAGICVYSSFMRVSSELQFVDFKLLFIIGTCLFWGRSYGLTAAVLCSIASITQSILGGTKWHVIFFHIDNWIPIATYLASAVLFGMYRDNQTKESLHE